MDTKVEEKKRGISRFKRLGAYLLVVAVLVCGGYMVKNALIEQDKSVSSIKEVQAEDVFFQEEENKEESNEESVIEDFAGLYFQPLKSDEEVHDFIVRMITKLGKLVRRDKKYLGYLRLLSLNFHTCEPYEYAMSYLLSKEDPTKDEIAGVFSFILISSYVRSYFDLTYADLLVMPGEEGTRQNKKKVKVDNRYYVMGRVRSDLDEFVDRHPKYAILREYVYIILGSRPDINLTGDEFIEKFNKGEIGEVMRSSSEFEEKQVSRFIDLLNSL